MAKNSDKKSRTIWFDVPKHFRRRTIMALLGVASSALLAAHKNKSKGNIPWKYNVYKGIILDNES